GQSLVFSSLRVADAEWYWRESEIYAVRLADNSVRQLTSRKGPDGNPTVSPDGRPIAYTGLDSTSPTWQAAQLSVMNADGTNHRVLTASLDRTPQQLLWAPDNSGIYFTTEDRGSRNLHFASRSGQVRQVTTGTHVLGVTSISTGG